MADMSDNHDHTCLRVRQGGKFIKASKKKWRENVLAAKKKSARIGSVTPKSCVGRRIVEIETLAENLWCRKCNVTLSLRNIQKELRFGLSSQFLIKCASCQSIQSVYSCKSSRTVHKHQIFDVNLKASLGVLDGGIGITQLNSLLSLLNIPAMAETTFKRHERLVGRKIEEFANDSCVKAIQAEAELTETLESCGDSAKSPDKHEMDNLFLLGAE